MFFCIGLKCVWVEEIIVEFLFVDESYDVLVVYVCEFLEVKGWFDIEKVWKFFNCLGFYYGLF